MIYNYNTLISRKDSNYDERSRHDMTSQHEMTSHLIYGIFGEKQIFPKLDRGLCLRHGIMSLFNAQL